MPARETRLNSFGSTAEEVPVSASHGTPAARSVSEVVALANATLVEDDILRDVWVKGEISSFFAAGSGHWYLDLKDDGALLKAVMWRSAAAAVKFQPAVGMEVLARGSLGVYKDRSQLQLQAKELRSLSAKGDLAVRFEQLRQRLAAEGLFDPARKRPLPEHPRRIGVVTSLNAAALRDILRVATERHPGVRILVADARVQGEGAADQIAAAIGRLDHTDCDVLIVGRGGGSAEDLWAFNEEVVVRAICRSRIPVVSAVGHETDFTLADFAADLRAATPSNAAETVVPDADALVDLLDAADDRARIVLGRLVPDLAQKLDELLTRAVDGVGRTRESANETLAIQSARLDALSPLATLARGFAVVKKDGKVVRSVEKASAGSDVEITLADGVLDATVTKRRMREDRS